MTPGEIYSLKRKNFLDKTQKYFEFLVAEFGFNEPIHFSSEQSNGTVIQDRLEYDRMDKKITILNAYHPVDYGFEINLTEKGNGRTVMLHSVLKENQDIEQNYLKSASEFLKNTFPSKFNNDKEKR